MRGTLNYLEKMFSSRLRFYFAREQAIGNAELEINRSVVTL